MPGFCLVELWLEMILDSAIFLCLLSGIQNNILQSLELMLWLVSKLCLTKQLFMFPFSSPFYVHKFSVEDFMILSINQSR